MWNTDYKTEAVLKLDTIPGTTNDSYTHLGYSWSLAMDVSLILKMYLVLVTAHFSYFSYSYFPKLTLNRKTEAKDWYGMV